MYKNWWTKDNFNIFALPLKIIKKIHNYEIILDEAVNDQDELKKLISSLENYNAKNKKKVEKKNRVLESGQFRSIKSRK